MVDVVITDIEDATWIADLEAETQWYEEASADRADKVSNTPLLIAAFALQLVAYLAAWFDAVDDRNDAMDARQHVLDYLHDTDLAVDFPMMVKKQFMLHVVVPTANTCTDSRRQDVQTKASGAGVVAFAEDEFKQVCGGVPDGWIVHGGVVNAARAQDYAGSLLGTSAKRREEQFRAQKVRLVTRAQSNARMSVVPVLQNYNEAIEIHERLASIFAGGFNSAGVGLGTAIGQMSGQQGQ